jgi:hypothetical protein
VAEKAAGGWAGAEDAHRTAWGALSHRERLRWLWEAKLFARRALEAAARRRGDALRSHERQRENPTDGEPAE